jgi:shikimate dehydrogenase
VLLGHPVAHSLSPRFQNAALRAAAIPLRYEALDVPPDELAGVMRALREAGAAGNVTVPHKAAIAARCDVLTETAARTGAVNAFRHDEGRLVGENTDVAGFVAFAATMIGPDPRGVCVAVLGAGGAAAAVCAAVSAWEGSRVILHARNAQRARSLAERFEGVVADVAGTVEEAVADADVVVNTTPVGLEGEAVPVAVGSLPRDAAVMDLAYRAGETPWVRAARAAGHRAADGLEMLIEQGAHAFEWWFGIPPDRDIMRRALTR